MRAAHAGSEAAPLRLESTNGSPMPPAPKAATLKYRTEVEERAYQWGLIGEDDPSGVGKRRSNALLNAMLDSLLKHSGPKLLSSHTLSAASVDTLMATKALLASYAKSIRVVVYYRNEKSYLLERYRFQDLFKAPMDELGAFKFPVYTLDLLIDSSKNSITKGMDGLTVNGEAIMEIGRAHV